MCASVAGMCKIGYQESQNYFNFETALKKGSVYLSTTKLVLRKRQPKKSYKTIGAFIFWLTSQESDVNLSSPRWTSFSLVDKS